MSSNLFLFATSQIPFFSSLHDNLAKQTSEIIPEAGMTVSVNSISKQLDIVSFIFTISTGLTKDVFKTIGVAPVGFRPSATLPLICHNVSDNTNGIAFIGSDGKITVLPSASAAYGVRVSGSYMV